MPVYTVHAPVNNGADLAATDKFTFVRDGFHFWAALLSPVWLVWHRLWLALLGWIAVTVAVEFGLMALGAGRGAIFAADLLIAILMGLEAATLQRWTRSRRCWHRSRQGHEPCRPASVLSAENRSSAAELTLGGWHFARGARIDRHRRAQRARQTLEAGFGDMMAVLAV